MFGPAPKSVAWNFKPVYVSIDIETLGTDPETCDVIEFGAVIDDLKSPLDDLPIFHRYLWKENYRGQPFAMAMHSKILHRIATREQGYRYITEDCLGVDFMHFLMENNFHSCIEENETCIKPFVAGKNFAGFDQKFLTKMEGFNNHVKPHRRTLDPMMLYYDPFAMEEPPSLQTCLQLAGYTSHVDHTAIADAFDVIKCLRYKWGVGPQSLVQG